MAVILFPKKEDMGRFYNSEFRSTSLFPQVNAQSLQALGLNLRLTERERQVLSEIEKTIVLMDVPVKHLLNRIRFPEVRQALFYQNRYTNWRDRSHFARLALDLLDKKLDQDVLSIMALVEIVYLGWLLLDEYMDEDPDCEKREPYYKKLSNPKSITGLALSLHELAAEVIAEVSRSRALHAENMINLHKAFGQMLDETLMGFYVDLETEIEGHVKEKVLELLNEPDCDTYRRKISLMWGSQFEAIARMVLSLYPDIEEEERVKLARLGREWGILLKMRDDIVDLFGDEEGLGRKPGSDVRLKEKSGNYWVVCFKLTLPICSLKTKLEYANSPIDINADKEQVHSEILKILKDYSFDHCRDQLLGQQSRIENLLLDFPDSPAKFSLTNLLRLASKMPTR